VVNKSIENVSNLYLFRINIHVDDTEGEMHKS